MQLMDLLLLIMWSINVDHFALSADLGGLYQLSQRSVSTLNVREDLFFDISTGFKSLAVCM